jgi:hypothetical protein
MHLFFNRGSMRKTVIITGPALGAEETAKIVGVSKRRFRELAELTGYSMESRTRSRNKRTASKKSAKTTARAKNG